MQQTHGPMILGNPDMMSHGTEDWMLQLSGWIEPKEGKHFAYCRELPVSGMGDSAEQAFQNLWATINAMFDIAEEAEVLDQFIAQYGGRRMSNLMYSRNGYGQFNVQMPHRATGEGEHAVV